VAVIYNNRWFPGFVEGTDNGLLTVKFMIRIRKAARFIWHDTIDRQIVEESGILCRLINAPHLVSAEHYAIHDSYEVDRLCQEVLSG